MQGTLITAFYNWLLSGKPTQTSTPSPTGTQPDMTTGTAITGGSTSATATPLPVLDICKVLKFDSFVMGYDGKTYVAGTIFGSLE